MLLFIKFTVLRHTKYFWSQLCLEHHPVDHFVGLSLSHLSMPLLLKIPHIVDHA